MGRDDSAGDVARQLDLAADHVLHGVSDEAVLAELLLRIGLDLTTPVTVEKMEGTKVYNVDNGAVLICLDRPSRWR